MKNNKILFAVPMNISYEKNALYIGLKKLYGKNLVLFPAYRNEGGRLAVDGKKTEELLKKISDSINSFDHILLGAKGIHLHKLHSVIDQKYRKNFHVIDQGDVPFVRRIYNAKKRGLYFKRENIADCKKSGKYLKRYRLGLARNKVKTLISALLNIKHCSYVLNELYMGPAFRYNIEACPLGIAETGITPEFDRKEYDAAFMALPSNRERKEIFDRLESIRKRHGLKIYLAKGNINFNEYINILKRSKIGINVKGWGIDTYRYYEIPCCGAMLLSEEPMISITNDFEEGKSAVFFKDLDDMEEKILRYLEKERWKGIAKNGNAHVKRYFTDKRIAERVIEKIEDWERAGQEKTRKAKHAR